MLPRFDFNCWVTCILCNEESSNSCNSKYKAIRQLYMQQEILKLSSDSYSGPWMLQMVICCGPKLQSMIPHHFPIFTWLITPPIVSTSNAQTASISLSLYLIGIVLASSPAVLHSQTSVTIAGTSFLVLRFEWAGSVTWMYAWTWPYPTYHLSHALQPTSFLNSSTTSLNW